MTEAMKKMLDLRRVTREDVGKTIREMMGIPGGPEESDEASRILLHMWARLDEAMAARHDRDALINHYEELLKPVTSIFNVMNGQQHTQWHLLPWVSSTLFGHVMQILVTQAEAYVRANNAPNYISQRLILGGGDGEKKIELLFAVAAPGKKLPDVMHAEAMRELAIYKDFADAAADLIPQLSAENSVPTRTSAFQWLVSALAKLEQNKETLPK